MGRAAKPTKLPDGKWRIRFTVDGQPKSLTFKTFKEANAALRDIHKEVDEGSYRSPSDDETLAQWREGYWPTQAHLRQATLDKHDQVWRNHLDRQWGDRKLRSITTLEIQAWVAEMIRSKMSAATVQKVYFCFTKLIRAAVIHGRLPKSPLPETSSIPYEKVKAIRYLEDDEIDRLADAIDARWRPLVLVGCYTGLRIRELAALRLRDLNSLRQEILVDEAQIDRAGVISYADPKTKKGHRSVPVADVAWGALLAHVNTFKELGPDDLLFRGPEGGPLRVDSWRQRFWNRAVKRANLWPLTPHDMRHTAASIFISAGASPWMLAEILGHRDTRMIDEVYGHLFDKDRQALLVRVSGRRQTSGKVVPIQRKKGA